MSVRRFALVMVASLCAMGGGLVLGSPAMALNVHVFSGSFGEEGAGEGQLKEPTGVAVNDTTHNVYVADHGNDRVEEFTSAGAYVGQFTPPGGFESPTQIAVDNSNNPLDPSAGDVYVVDSAQKKGRNVVDKFSEDGVYEGALTVGEGGNPFGYLAGVTVDPSGVVWVSQERESHNAIESFTDAHENTFLSQIKLFFEVQRGLAADSEGRLYIDRAGGTFQRTSSGKTKEIDPSERVGGVAVDPSNNEVYLSVGETSEVGERVGAYDSEGKVLERFGSGNLTAGSGIAIDSSTHAVYVADSAADRVVVFDQVVLPDVSTGEEPTNLHEGGVTLDGTVNPDGLPITSCKFEYGTDKSYGNVAACEPSPGSGSGPVEVHADIGGLLPLSAYHYRLVAGNANGSNDGIDRSFTAAIKASVDAESVFDVSSDSASFSGQVNSGGTGTSYRFEYGTTAAYGKSVSGGAGSQAEDVEVHGHAQGLQAGSTYHYRLVAESPLGTVVGEDRIFITEPAVSGAELPDGRAWEMVSPPNKQGASVGPIGAQEGRLIQAAEDGSAISYAATGPTEEAPPGERSPEEVQIFSALAPGGWVTKVIATPHDTAHAGDTAGHNSEYTFFSSDLSLAVVQAQGTTPLSEETSERTPYLRHDTICEAQPATCYQPLVTAANTAPGTKFGGNIESLFGEVTVAGGTPDLHHIVLSSGVALTPGGSPGLYEWSGGKLTFLAKMGFGNKSADVRHGISDDGSRVIGDSTFEFSKGLFEPDLVMRDVTDGTTTRLDVAESGASGGSAEPVFQTASSDGSRVFFTDEAQLTTSSTASVSPPNMSDLYEYDVKTGKVSDLSVPLNPGEHADVRGDVVGTSEDGSYVYFAANGVLAAGAIQGDCGTRSSNEMCSLYVSHDGTTTLVAILSGEDGHSFALQGGLLDELTARVSPNGRWLAFMSERSLTGYDNRDAISGEPDEEVFLYDAEPAPNGKHLVCASCAPTGGRPIGALARGAAQGQQTTLADGRGTWEGRWLAATIPGWTNNQGGSAAYQSRYLSDSGRLFFDSSEALAPQDTDGTWDVYQYEPPNSTAGAPSNDTCVSGSTTYSSASGGCVGLISSGGSHEESVFLDASEAGDDVFFLTAAGLSSQDYDGALDVYDAHVCSTEFPCLPVPPVSPPPCSTGDSCKTAPSPQPEIFGSPSSETFSGAGNVTASGGVARVAPKALTNKQKLARALQRCRKKPKRKRAACQRQAKKRYAKKASLKSRVAKSVSSGTGR